MLEFLFDTTRAVVNLVLNGTVARHPDLRLIIPHAGATLPVIADRAGQPFDHVSLPTTPHSLHGADAQLYVDTLLRWAKSLPS